uniref:Opsin L1 n=2 Tax=Neogonodactylus oerstedii TaxID=85128 RepID=A0A6H0X1K8_NEOOE|nr:opsin L1 [Neogonodactylus oerstedii]
MSYWNSNKAMEEYSLPSTNPYGNFTVVDTVPENMLHMIHSHWYQFPPLNPMWYGILAFVVTVVGLCSICGNFVVIWVFMNTKALRSPANTLVVSLAVSDFIMMACMFPPLVLNCYWGTWIFGPLFCEVYAFIGNTVGCASIGNMIFITFDRYNVIVKGVSGTPLSQKNATLQVLFVWICSIMWCVFPFFGWNRYVPEGNMTACGTDYLTEDEFSRSYLYVYSVWVYIGPLALIIYCYFHIVSAVATHEKQMRDQAKKMGVKSLRTEEAKKTSAECRLAKVALTTVSLWFMAWTPYLIINWAGMFYPSVVSPLFSIWGSVFAKANAVYNLIVYAISHPKYRAALYKKLPCLACSTESADEGSATNSATTTTAEKYESA